MTPTTSRLASFLVTGALLAAVGPLATGCGNGDDDDHVATDAGAGTDAAADGDIPIGTIPTGTTYDLGCDVKASNGAHSCVEYDFLTSDQYAQLQSACPGMGGTVVSNDQDLPSCTDDGSVGSCEVATGSNVKQVTTYYSDDGYTAAQAEAACTAANGAFKPYGG